LLPPVRADLQGKRAIVTGAARGIGQALAEGLAKAGSSVIAVDKDATQLARAFNQVSGVDIVVADIGANDMEDLGRKLVDDYGPIQLIVNNVGIYRPQRFLDIAPADWDEVFATNLRGPWFLTRTLLNELRQRDERGSLLFISSLHDTIVRHAPHYSASKAAVAMLVRELANEFAPTGIRVNALSPGWIETAMSPATDWERREAHRLIPMRQIGAPKDLVELALLLLSDEAAGYVTGVNMRVDGGLALHTWHDDLGRSSDGG
jgi:NAD(P)-dependent dehydrogenase (short-subunit alcohol dehydrogenase family)